MKYRVNFGNQEIKFELERKNVKNINLTIRPDMSIFVSANDKVPLDVILDFVKERSPWISSRLEYFREHQPEPRSKREYVSGESFRYLGRQYRLKVEEADFDQVKYFRGYIYLYTKDMNKTDKNKELFTNWLDERANIIFRESLDRMYEIIKKYDIPKPKMKIRQMKARWGSCYRDRNMIVLNSELIKAPRHCIDYVVLHELIHFIYRHHDNDFYSFLTTLMPDWEARKKILDEEVVREL